MKLEVNGKVYELIDQLKTRDGLKIYPLYKKMEEGQIDEMTLGVEVLSLMIRKIIDGGKTIEGDKIKDYILDLDLNEFTELSEKAMEHLNKLMESLKKK